MPEELTQKIRRLLQPTYDLATWRAAVASLDAEEAIPVLIAIMNNDLEAEQIRSQAATLLGILGDARAVDALSAALDSEDNTVGARAALALGQIGHPVEKIVAALIKGLGKEDYFVRECCAKVLGSLKSAEALPALAQMSATDSVSTNREVAQQAIASIQEVT